MAVNGYDHFSGDGVALSGTSNMTTGSSVKGVQTAIYSNGGYGIHISAVTPRLPANNNSVVGTFIGSSNGIGGFNSGNDLGGVLIENGASGNTIGGLAEARWNVISSNFGPGVTIEDANNNVIAGNYIGPDKSGKRKARGGIVGTQTFGVLVEGNSSYNTIGASHPVVSLGSLGAFGAAAAVIISPANVISANVTGIRIQGTGTGNKIQGSYIGTTVNGNDASLGNFDNGIEIDGSSGNLIGGPLPALGNVIVNSGKIKNGTGNGVEISNSRNNVIQNNNIGVGSDGNINGNLGNVTNGIYFSIATVGNVVRNNVIANNGSNVTDDGIFTALGIRTLGNKIFDPNSFSGSGLGIETGSTAGRPTLTSAVASGGRAIASYFLEKPVRIWSSTASSQPARKRLPRRLSFTVVSFCKIDSASRRSMPRFSGL